MSDENIDTSIGGNAEERTQRGFAIYGRIVDSHGNVTRVQRSSAMGGPYCHVFTKDGDGRDVVPCVGARGNVLSVSPHLDATQARALAALLVAFADDAEAAALGDVPDDGHRYSPSSANSSRSACAVCGYDRDAHDATEAP